MQKRLLFIFQHSPESSGTGIDGIDAALTAATLGLDIDVLFMTPGDAILATPEAREKLQQLHMFIEKPFYIVCSETAKNTVNDANVNKIDLSEVRNMFDSADSILSF